MRFESLFKTVSWIMKRCIKIVRLMTVPTVTAATVIIVMRINLIHSQNKIASKFVSVRVIIDNGILSNIRK